MLKTVACLEHQNPVCPKDAASLGDGTGTTRNSRTSKTFRTTSTARTSETPKNNKNQDNYLYS